MKVLGSHGGEGGDALTDLEISLIGIQTTICEAENIWIKDENLQQNMNKLLVLLKDAVYDAEDLLDKFHFLKLQQQIKQQENEASDTTSSSSSSFLSRPTKKIKVGEIIDQNDVNEIRKIQEKVERINTATKKLLDSDNNQKIQKIDEISRATSSIPIEAQVFGRDNEMNELVRFLIELQCGFEASSSISVLAVTGMGGVGKTTLAQEAYNDWRVAEHFELRMWVCVSGDFNVVRHTKDIIESATNRKCDLLNLDALQVILKQIIISKRFLLVLDDVWSENRHEWDSLCAPLRYGAMGSKILVTTRNVKIANMVGNMNPIRLNGFDDDISWEIFKKCAFGSQNSRDQPRLEAIAKEMVPKLKGLPLAAKTLGGLLNMNMDVRHWKTIMDSEIWKLPQGENGVLQVLQHSYHYLPAHLKRCFAFCSLYSKDYMFDEHELVRIWMAEGFFPIQENITMEDFGSRCFQELVSRCFFQRTQDLYKYVMNDFMHDLAQLISRGETYMHEDGKPFEIPTMLRHLNVACINDRELRTMVKLYDFKKLRTLICPSQHSFMNSMLTCGFSNRLQRIRTLILKDCGLKELPESIGNFIHLRYLDISENSKISRLPASLFELYNLQTLILKSCDLHELPNSVGNLVCLRHLDISCNENVNKLPALLCHLSNLQTLHLSHCYGLRSLPRGMSKLINLRKLVAIDYLVYEITEIGKLTSLQSLSFKVRKVHGHKLAELNGLTELRETLKITGLENVENTKEAIAANLQSKVYLDELVLQWTTYQEDDALLVSEEVLEYLQPNSTLRRLRITGYNGIGSPSWLDPESLPELETLSLEDCKRWDDLSFIRKFSHLKSLLLKRMPAVKQIRQELFGSAESNSFHQLEKFVLEDMTLEELQFLGQLPHLKFLCIRRMAKLEIDYDFVNSLGKNLFQSLEAIELQDIICTELPLIEQLPSLKVLRIDGMAAVKKLWHGSFAFKSHCEFFSMLEELIISNMPVCQVWSCAEDREWFPCLSTLEIYNCPLIERLPRLPPSLKRLTVNQVGLIEFPGIQEGIGASSSNMAVVSLSKLCISECPNLTSLDQIECFHFLSFLEIDNCPLIKGFPLLPSSVEMLILNQVGLTEFPGMQEKIGGSSSNRILSRLVISNLPNLTSLDRIEYFHCLSILEIEDCQLLTRLPPLPPSLVELQLIQVGLTELPRIGGSSSNIIITSSLSKLHIEECSKMTSLEQGLLFYNLPKLKTILLKNCGELLWMPVKKFKDFTYLECLSIDNCPKLTSMTQDDDIHLLLPLSIQRLRLSNCGEVGRSLPGCLYNLTNLTELEVCDCPYLVTLAREPLLHLERLDTLRLLNCNELRSIEGLGVLKSLKTLEIHGCLRFQQNGKEKISSH